MNRVYTLLGGAVCLFATAMNAPAQKNVVLTTPKHSIPSHQTRVEESVASSKLRIGVPTKKATTNSVLSPAEAPKGLKLGYTYYDFQTNACMPERVVVSNEPGSENVYAQMFWMASKDSTRGEFTAGAPGASGFNDSRGAHYAIVDITDKANPQNVSESWDKIPTENGLRRGWPNIVQFKDGSIGTSSHTPMEFAYATSFGSPPNRKIEVAPGETLWGRIAVDGKDYVHMIYTYQVAAGSNSSLFYRRSTDKGRSWGEEILLSDDGQLQGGDVYAIAANGDNVVAVYGTRGLQVAYKKSTDNGESWSEQPLAVMNPQFTDGRVENDPLGGNDVKVYTDTLLSCGNHIDVILDNDGKAHFVFNEMIAYVIRDGARDGDSVVITSGTIYDIDDVQAYAGRKLGFWYWEEGADTRYRICQPPVAMVPDETDIVSRRRYSGLVRYPQLGLGKDNTLYLTYNSVIEGDVVDVAVDTNTTRDGIPDQTIKGYYGHIYVTHKPGGSTQWSMPVNITPNGNDCLFPSMFNSVDGNMFIAYSADAIPGDRVTNTELPTEETGIYFEIVPTSVLSNTLYQPQTLGFTEQIAIRNLDKSLTSVQEQPETSSIIIRPNPAKDYMTIDFVTNQTGNVSVDIVDQLGNIVLSHTVLDASSQEIMLSLKTLSAGMYSARIQQGNQFITKSFVVIK